MKQRIVCGCGKIISEDEGFDFNKDQVIQKPISCLSCKANHACCVKLSPEHAIELLTSMGYLIKAVKTD